MGPRSLSKEAVLAEARRVVADAGGTAPTMEELAAGAGVSRATLFKLFGTRAALLEALGLAPAPAMADRIVAAAGLLAERGLTGLTVDEAAARAGASRATAFRLFPGKGVLFREVLRANLPTEDIVTLLEERADRPPREVMPLVARRLAALGPPQLAVLRSAMFEFTGLEDDLEEAVAYSMRGLGALTGYLSGQMAAGRLAPMHPVLALEAFVAPIVMHLLQREGLQRVGFDLPAEQAVDELARAWLRAMAPPRRARATQKSTL